MGQVYGVSLEIAAVTGDKEVAAILTKAGAAVGGAIHAAIRVGREQMVDLLLDNGGSIGDLDVGGETRLHAAARAGKLGMTRYLLRRGADTNAVSTAGGTPLYWAARLGRVAVAEALLAAGADDTLRYTEGQLSALDVAVGFGHTDIVRVLIEHGTDLNAAGAEGQTALYWGVYADKAKAIGLLAEAGANTEARTSAGRFVGEALLHLALDLFKRTAAVALLRNGADVDVTNKDGETPLHLAAGQLAARMVDLLLRMGADETVVDGNGLTPMDVAGKERSDAHNVECVQRLLANAAVDRVWRRRGFLVMCRAHSDRMQLKGSSSQVGIAGRTRGRVKKITAGVGASDSSIGGSAVHKGINGEWSSVAARMAKLKEDGLFRKIVGYL